MKSLTVTLIKTNTFSQDSLIFLHSIFRKLCGVYASVECLYFIFKLTEAFKYKNQKRSESPASFITTESSKRITFGCTSFLACLAESGLRQIKYIAKCNAYTTLSTCMYKNTDSQENANSNVANLMKIISHQKSYTLNFKKFTIVNCFIFFVLHLLINFSCAP